MVTFREITNGLHKLELDLSRPVVAHASLSAFGEVAGGASTLLGALLSTFESLIMPAFTYKTMVIPEDGPAENAIKYGSGKDTNRMATFYTQDMPVDRLIGVVAETLRQHHQAIRSSHPILSFVGINAEQALHAQSLEEPLAPIRVLMEQDGYVLLLGVGNTSNTSIHAIEKMAGRKQFIRWALTPQGVCACPGFPGCSDGFSALDPILAPSVRKVQIGAADVKAIPLQALKEIILDVLADDPQALLCSRKACERCDAVRHSEVRV